MTIQNLLKGSLLIGSTVLIVNCGGGHKEFETNEKKDSTETKDVQIDTVAQVKPEYKSVSINNLEWMTENLDVVVFRNGDTIPEIKENSDWANAGKSGQAAWCYYNNDPAKGKLYNFHAVNDPRGLAPEGWRIPENKEFEDLIKSLGGTKTAGAKLKDSESWGEKGKGTNETGFSAKPSGMRNHIGEFSNYESFGYWWSASDRAKENAWHISLNNNNAVAKDYFSQQANAFSVRCVKK